MISDKALKELKKDIEVLHIIKRNLKAKLVTEKIYGDTLCLQGLITEKVDISKVMEWLDVAD